MKNRFRGFLPGIRYVSIVFLAWMIVMSSSPVFPQSPMDTLLEGYISREFFQVENDAEGHPGLDLVAPDGAPVKAAGRGTVLDMGRAEEGGPPRWRIPLPP